MSEETKVSNEDQVTSPEPEPELDLDTPAEEEPEADGSSEVEELKVKVAEMDSLNKQLYARLKKEEHKTEKPPNSQPDEGDLDWRQKIEFVTTKGRNLDADDVDEVIAYAKGKKISYDDALKSEVIKGYLRVKQAKQRVAQATPAPSSGSQTFQGKKWNDMSEEDQKKNYNKFVGSLKK